MYHTNVAPLCNNQHMYRSEGIYVRYCVPEPQAYMRCRVPVSTNNY